jgi:hypothetical protein
MDTLFGGPALGWVKVADDFPTHPKAMRAGPQGRSLYLYSLMWCGLHSTNGAVPAEAVPYLALCLGVPTEQIGEVADKLVECGLWERQPDGWSVHDWMDWQTHRDDVKRAEQNRKAQLRARQKASNPYSAVTRPYSAVTLTSGNVSHPEPDTEPEVDKPPPTPPIPASLVRDYEEVYALYPRKLNKKAGLRAYIATMRRGVNKTDLLTATEGFAKAMAAEGREWKLIKHVSTFFGPDEPWEDYLPGGEGVKQQHTSGVRETSNGTVMFVKGTR